jgi:hypothetical protein
MAFRALGLLATGAAVGLAADRVAMELRKPEADRFPWLRHQMNDSVNPWLMEHGIPGSAKAEIATLEHIGRRSRMTYFTPVHPTIHEDTVLIPAPLGVGSQWAHNVLDAGRARLQFHETLYELDQPELITVTDAGVVPPQLAAPFDHLGWRYLRLHRVAEVPGTFATHKAWVPVVSTPAAEPPLEGAYEMPVEPRMVEHEVPTT